MREHLPDERDSVTKKFEIHGLDEKGRPMKYTGYLIVGLYPDGRPGELFVRFAKIGGRQGALMDAWATVLSIALQSGVSLKTLTSKFSWGRFEPAGLTNDKNIPICTSPLDYICKWLNRRFDVDVDGEDKPAIGDLVALGEERNSEQQESA